MEKDNNNTPPQEDVGLLLAAFGSTRAPARAAYAALEESVRTAFPGRIPAWAYTSPTVRKKLAEKGEIFHDPQETLARLASAGMRRVAVLSAHIAPGDEFHRLCAACKSPLPGRPWPESVEIAAPLLADNADLAALAEGLIAEEGASLAADEGALFVGHGTAHGGGMVYPALQYFFSSLRPNFFVCALEGEPKLSHALREAQKAGLKRLRLLPLMTVAGEHIASDMLGEGEDSIINRAKAAGFSCAPSRRALAERPCAQNIWLKHLHAAIARCLSPEAL